MEFGILEYVFFLLHIWNILVKMFFMKFFESFTKEKDIVAMAQKTKFNLSG